MYVCMHVCMYVYVCKYIYIYMYVCIYHSTDFRDPQKGTHILANPNP